jgi:uncharacterized protein (DUF58 family)
MPVATWRLAVMAAVVSVAVALVTRGPGWLMIAADGGLLLAAAADAFLAPSPGRVGVAREMPGTLTLGSEGGIVWRVTNPSSRPLTLALADELAPSLGPTTRRVTVRLPPGATVATRAGIRPTRRGRFEPAELDVRVLGPLGLAGRQARRSLPGLIRVLPPFRSRREAELRIDRARILEVGLRSAQGLGGGTEFDSLREYSVDDEFRRIDWAATARTDKTIVRTYRAERNQTVLLLLDCGRLMAGRVDGVPRLDHAMDAALCLAAVATRLGDRAGLVAFDREVRAVVPPGHGPAQLGKVIQAMYALDPQLVESDYRGVFAETLARWRRRALLVVLTELGEEALTEIMVPALPLLASRHIVLVGAVSDPDVLRWAEAVPTEARTAYRKASAMSTLDHRDRTAGRLRGLGATVIDAGPGRLAGALADAYLHVKATGRL